MKPFLPLLSGILLCISLPFHTFSQCGPGLGPFTITYDTVIYGTGSSSYALSLPKFSIPLGVLLSANIKTTINLKYGYTIDNTTSSTQIYRAKLTRTDDITSPALDPSPAVALSSTLSNIVYGLAPGAHVSYGPVNKTYVANDSIITSNPKLINFMGTGNVDFDYETGTSYLVPPSNGVLVNPTVTDTMRLSISYLYCLTSLLSNDLLFFNAVAQGKGKVLLSWRQANVSIGRIYDLQVSTDGKNFTDITSVNENASGNYVYTYLHNASSRLYFRIKEKETSGEIKYSAIRIVDPGGNVKPVVTIVPSLYTGGSLQINFPYKADWYVNFYSAEGKRVAESKQTGVSIAQVELPAVSNGTYTAEIINTQTKERQFTRIIVQR